MSRKIRFTIIMEMFLHSWCKTAKFCSLVHHVTSEDTYGSPVVFINPQGNVHLQMKLSDGLSYALSTPWSVPLEQWVRLDVMQMNTFINVTLSYGKNNSQSLYFSGKFHLPVMYKESDGYLSFGGSLFVRNFDGIMSYAKFCRNKALTSDRIEIPKRPDPINDRFYKIYKRQKRVLKQAVTKRWLTHSDKHMKKHDVSIPYFLEVIQNATNSRKHLYAQCSLDEKPVSLHLEKIEKILGKLSTTFNISSVHSKTGEELHNIFLKNLDYPETIRNMGQSIKLLKQSARLGHTLSNYFLYSIFKNGIGVKKDLTKARFHLLVGAHKGDRMSMKAIAYNHMHGLCGFPRDIDIAFYYYFNLAHKTQKDLLDHSGELASVNMARLTDEKVMKDQLSEDDNVFQWMKHQASKGAFSAQRNMGRLLYWGQQGVQRNLNAAFKYYEEAAKGGDPTALYDYGIILMKGHGTGVDQGKAVEVLQQAAELKNSAALNTLGWYYTQKEVNMTKAAEYFEKSDELGNIGATYNLAHMYNSGTYPGKGRDMKMAFAKFYKAAAGGHVEAAVQVAYLTAIGIKGVLARNIFSATEWAQYLTDKSPLMGLLIKDGLQAYRRKDWTKALFLYLLMADTGFEVAQFNTAFLCEEDKDNVVSSIQEDCVWKNWNASSLNRIKHPYAVNKMGDYHYYGHGGEANLDEAIVHYGNAAKLNFPQSLFNLADILENHNNIEMNKTLEELSLPKEALSTREDAIVHLYRKCTTINSGESVTPCYIALMRTQICLMWKRTSILAKVITFVVIISTTLILAWINLRRKKAPTTIDAAAAAQERIEKGRNFPEATESDEDPIAVEPQVTEQDES